MIKVHLLSRSGRRYIEMRWADPVTGKIKTQSTGTAVQREAERARARKEVELAQGFSVEADRITWKDFRERYEADVWPGQRETTRQKTRDTFSLIKTVVNPQRLVAIDERQIERIVAHCRKLGRSEWTTRSHLTNIRRCLRWAYAKRLISRVPTIQMPAPAAPTRGRAITREECERMLKAVPKVTGKDHAAPWRFLLKGLWLSGLRLNEALCLRWDTDGWIRVDFSGRRPLFWVGAAQKNGQAQFTPMTPGFADFLNAIPEGRKAGLVFDLPSVRRPGRKLTLDHVSRMITKIGKKAGVKVSQSASGKVKYASAHDLRRSFGERWSMRVRPTILMQLMRHADIKTTLMFYARDNASRATAEIYKARKRNTSSNTDRTTGPEANSSEPQTAAE